MDVSGIQFASIKEYTWAKPPDPFAELPALAERLGVKPSEPGEVCAVALMMPDGRHYDVFKLINAVLDRLDKAGSAA